ncbi:MAG: radical SAM protein [Bacteroidetes bacterium]|nr:radical SAM protein [Bacteroidota bacterium]
MNPKIFIVTPPFTQLNTPYPATAYLKGFLKTLDIEATQADLGIEVILELFSSKGLKNLFEHCGLPSEDWSQNARRIFALRADYIQTIDSVIGFLQGKNPTLALQICQHYFLPEASRFADLQELDWAFGSMGTQDKAKHMATLYLEDLADFVVETVDAHFGFSRYAEQLGRSAQSFDELYSALQSNPTYIDALLFELLDKKIKQFQPDLVLVSVPFPGNLYAAFRLAQWFKKNYPKTKIALGGGFANTELRSLSEVRVFEFFDYVTLDDGELPVELLIQNLNSEKPIYKRTFLLENGQVVYKNDAPQADYKMSQVGTPDYSDLLLDQYISVIEVANPMHKMWSDGRWNKLTMAHGCYWGKCTFCDISLDYIKVYEPIAARLIVDRIEELIAQTGETGFHFVDEAAPPALMREVAFEILRRGLTITWWTNIRFEKSFTADLCWLLKASGCIAVSGGLEVASDRLLALIDKGVTVEQVAQVTRNFTQAGIMVHAYLMYGYPTQTVQETVDSLEMVRQLFEAGIVQSGFWHRFAMTAHSPVGLYPEQFGVARTTHPDGTFANNDLLFEDATQIDHDQFSFGLRKSLYNYMHGICFDEPLQNWFEVKIPRTTIAADFIQKALNQNIEFKIKPQAKLIWLGAEPSLQIKTKTKKDHSWEVSELTFHNRFNHFEISLDKEQGVWLAAFLLELIPQASPRLTIQNMQTSFEAQFEHFELFWFSKPMQQLRANGLLAV